MTLNLIAAVGKNRELGRNNNLIWHFKEDMQFFKATTMGAAVIMGRKTFESLPKALPGRQNIVVSSNRGYTAEGAEVVASVDEALSAVKGDAAFVIGGGRLYTQMLPLCDKLFLTEIDGECPDADTFFPEFDIALYEREVLSEKHDGDTSFVHAVYTKR